MKLTVAVTAKHIAAGCMLDPCRCPIARALADALPQDFAALIKVMPQGGGRWYARWRVPLSGYWRFARLPDDAARAAKAFDNSGRMAPFAFEFDSEAQ